jgi:hypothetical protein
LMIGLLTTLSAGPGRFSVARLLPLLKSMQ